LPISDFQFPISKAATRDQYSIGNWQLAIGNFGMSNTVQGVPTPADFPITAGNADYRVIKNADGTVKAASNFGPFVRFGRTRPIWRAENPYCPEHEYDAVVSAHAMMADHDQLIEDASQYPDPDPYKRQNLWWSYYNLSTKQFCDDDNRARAGLDKQLTYSADGIAPVPPELIAQRALSRNLNSLRIADQHALDELLYYYGPGRTAADIAEKLATNPYQERWVQAYLQEAYGPATTGIDPSTIPKTVTVTGTAPMPELGHLGDGGIANPSLPPGARNTYTYDQRLEREARLAKGIVARAPELYEEEQTTEAQRDFQLRSYNYWKENYPTVRLLASLNPAFTQAQLDTPWRGPGLAPIVIVEITPRQRPLPELGWVASNISWLGLVASVIPLVGGIIAAGLNYETNHEVHKWADAWKPNSSEFAPQFSPRPFQVPLPLDRAQLIVMEPWYALAIVDEFADEVFKNRYAYASEQYAAMLAAQNGETLTQLTPASALPNTQGTAQKDTITFPTDAAAGSALPFLIAAALLVAGAPVAVPVAVVILFAQKK
jgi:hypothetical protein